jgi:hypothetical protein
MAKTIYQLFMMRPSEAWYQLSKEEQDNLLAKQEESSKKAGAKTLVFADSAWSNEEWMYFGLHEFSDIEALQKHAKELGDIQWFRYIVSKVILGTEWSETEWEQS